MAWDFVLEFKGWRRGLGRREKRCPASISGKLSAPAKPARIIFKVTYPDFRWFSGPGRVARADGRREDGGRRSWEDDGEARLRARHRLTTSRTFACGLKSNAFKDWGAKLRTRPVCLLPHPAEGLRRSDARDSIQGKSVWSITHPAKGREDREPNSSARCGTEHAGSVRSPLIPPAFVQSLKALD